MSVMESDMLKNKGIKAMKKYSKNWMNYLKK